MDFSFALIMPIDDLFTHGPTLTRQIADVCNSIVDDSPIVNELSVAVVTKLGELIKVMEERRTTVDQLMHVKTVLAVAPTVRATQEIISAPGSTEISKKMMCIIQMACNYRIELNLCTA